MKLQLLWDRLLLWVDDAIHSMIDILAPLFTVLAVIGSTLIWVSWFLGGPELAVPTIAVAAPPAVVLALVYWGLRALYINLRR